MSVPPLKRSKTEVTVNSNVVTLENINDVNEEWFQRTTHKGKLFKGPNWTAYNKENLGSIPRRIEKSLIEDKKSLSKVGFFTQTERFYPRNQTMKQNPGPGTYNILDTSMTRTQTSFYSSKGFGNGFVSGAERFDDSKFYYEKYAPGPGEYRAEISKTMEHDVATTLLGKSLYANKKTKSLKGKRETPGPGYYEPAISQFDHFYIPNCKDSVFKSEVNRFSKKDKFKVPGPGKYFKDDNYLDYNETKEMNKPSPFFRIPQSEKVDLLKKFDIKTTQEKEDARFKLKDKKGRIKNSQGVPEVDFLQAYRLGFNSNNPLVLTKKDLFKLRNKAFMKESSAIAVEKPKTAGNLMILNGGMDSDKGMEYIHKILHKPKKPDLFELNSQRWNENKLDFKVPGPSYYHPRKPELRLSFNKNNVDFIVSPGVVNQVPDESFYFA